MISNKNKQLKKTDLEHLEKLNGITITVLDGGHMSHIENKENLLQQIVDFVS